MAALAPDPPVKLEWADVPSERVTDAEASELEELLVRYVKSNHAVPTPNGMPLRSRAGQAYERPHLSLLQKHYPSFRLHDAVTELVGLHRLATALRMLRTVRHCELHGVQSGAQLPSADYFGRSTATRIEPPAGKLLRA